MNPIRLRLQLPQILATAVCLVALSAGLTGCGSEGTSPATGSGQPNNSGSGSTAGTALTPLAVKDSAKALGHAQAKVENVTISTEDGIAIAMTVYSPVLAAGEATPLLLHSHGFGGNRVATLDFDEATQTSEIGIDALQLAFNEKNKVAGRAGWYVLSYDQAGHGDSGGNVNIMDPTYEGKMLKAVLDWAEANLSNLAYRSKAGKLNPVVGTIGRSYGGAFQLMAAGIDDRIDAMVPGGTWFDLRYSLNPNGVPKTTYLNALVLSGLQSNQGRFEPFLYEELLRASTTNVVTEPTIRRLGSNGSISYCTNTDFGEFKRMMTLKSDIPALFVQGAHDIIFNLNEGIQNFECYNRVNLNAKLLMVKYGHSLDALMLQASPSAALAGTGAKYAFNESKVWLKTISANCPAALFDVQTGRCVMDLKNIMFQFLVEHLIGANSAKSKAYLGFDPLMIPKVTTVVEDGRADSTAIAVEPVQINSLINGEVGSLSEATAPTALFEQATGLTGVLSGLGDTALSALAQPIFKPLSNGAVPGCYVGTPKAKVTISPAVLPAESPDLPIVYVGLGLSRAGGTSKVLHEQLAPLKGYGTFEIPLPGISVKVNQGDALSLTVQGYSPAFSTTFNKIPAPVTVRAQIALPKPVQDLAKECK